MQRGEANVSAEDERDMEIRVLCPLPASRECWCSIYSSQPPPPFFFIAEGKWKTVKRKQKRHPEELQTSVTNRFNISWKWRQRAEPWLFNYLFISNYCCVHSTPSNTAYRFPDTACKKTPVGLLADSCLTLPTSEGWLSSTGAFTLWATKKISRWLEECIFSLQWPNLPLQQTRLWPARYSF